MHPFFRATAQRLNWHGLGSALAVAVLLERRVQGDDTATEPTAPASPECISEAIIYSSFRLGITGWGAHAETIKLVDELGNDRLNFGQVVDSNLVWQKLNLISNPASDPNGHDNFNRVSVSAGEVQELRSTARTVAIACGEFHTLLLQQDGRVVARGWNAAGQINVPEGLTNAVRIAAGADHSLAIRTDGTVIAWGWNESGQCQVPEDLRDVVAIAGGGTHSLALRRDGSVVGWGGNEFGQASVPSELRGVQAVSAGGRHSLALRRDGSISGWGDNRYGQSAPPAGEKTTVDVAAGGYFSVALRSNGTIFAWGDGSHGQTNIPSSATNIVAIAAGNYHALALRRDGLVVGWGEPSFGSLAIPPQLSGVAAIAAGGYHNEALQYHTPAVRIRRVTSARAEVSLELNLVADREFGIESSPDLSTWTEIHRGITRAGQMDWEPATTGTPTFFRISQVSPRPHVRELGDPIP